MPQNSIRQNYFHKSPNKTIIILIRFWTKLFQAFLVSSRIKQDKMNENDDKKSEGILFLPRCTVC